MRDSLISLQVAPNEIFSMDKCDFVAGTSLPHNDNIEPNQEKSEHDVLATDPKAKVKPTLLY